jgi:hypothetical protein
MVMSGFTHTGLSASPVLGYTKAFGMQQDKKGWRHAEDFGRQPQPNQNYTV